MSCSSHARLESEARSLWTVSYAVLWLQLSVRSWTVSLSFKFLFFSLTLKFPVSPSAFAERKISRDPSGRKKKAFPFSKIRLSKNKEGKYKCERGSRNKEVRGTTKRARFLVTVLPTPLVESV